MTATLDGSAVRPATDSAVRLAGVHKTFGQGAHSVPALAGVDLDVAPGEFVCLLGASGCGKTTLLNIIAGLDRPTTGELELNSSRPAVMFQEAALMPWLTASANVELPLRLAGVPRAARKSRTIELLDLVRLGGVGGKRPHELSGGMRQRVALARALASALHTGGSSDVPSLLLMDEPFSALDAITRDVLQAELLRVWRSTGAAVVFVTHDVREAVRLGQRVVLLSSRPGRVVQQWQVGDLSGAEEAETVDVVNQRLREVISSHATA
ncbi:ABC transporter ATP-binding protein [Amycolatopsis acidiphila]|uniref:ABC transporter ATP-binding protein n=1 Tax=Amycolatopsis acidiphila TaxID=715473 RepID=A0A558A5Z8_9PSEU|nr:ABC transporter ATP-binding protein [Amycolatopsis acidiphila]TVT19680.1 ABC transporter ATP-binding protein [Amycolatopsis acidiphila]UIJ61801.1 ABC transporter ATP-binding protein [Amycolatopsis acidiphila]GHG57868.1 sulfate ABC transporter ATP-binding protein [Amycolatopsis acidiphila]